MCNECILYPCVVCKQIIYGDGSFYLNNKTVGESPLCPDTFCFL